MPTHKTLRLILGDQLNINHSWFKTVNHDVHYVLMEVRSESEYATHHIQKVLAFFAAMRSFAELLKTEGHQVKYIKINDSHNLHSIDANCKALIEDQNYTYFEYLLPDEYRLQNLLDKLVSNISITHQSHDTEHFYTTRNELKDFFAGKKQLLMETFYRAMRKKHKVLMLGDEPLFGKWNLDAENREKLPKNHKPLKPYLFKNNLSDLHQEIIHAHLKTIGTVEAESFIWPTNREQSLQILDFFVENCLPHFGTFQDAMTVNEWSLYHSRLSFSLNVKLISPHEVIEKAITHFHNHEDKISYNQLEGFVRQIIGWREYMRGIYWMQMPEYAQLNFFNHERKLPSWFWNGKTKMACLSHSINQSLKYAYAHHIQRLMVTGNFALLAGIHPDEVDAWYLGIYIDAIEWVEITNTRGMSQYADGGIVASKPYVSSAAYIHKMGDYCTHCHYNKSIKVGEKACPFNSLYWHFFARNEDKLKSNPRIGMAYVTWQKMEATAKEALINQADYYLENLETL